MERSTWRENTVAAFSININELGGICSQLRQEFRNANNVRISIEFNFPNEDFTFESVDDIRANDMHIDKSTRFSLTMISSSDYSNSYDYFVLKYPLYSGSDVSIRSSSDSEAWCAGINEAAISYLRRYRTWYHWLVHRFVWWPFGILTAIFISVFAYDLLPTPFRALASPSLLALCLVFLSYKHRILPSGTIRIRRRNRDIKTVFIIVGVLAAIVSAASGVFTTINNFLK